LIDDRFGESKVKQLLPRWWAVQIPGMTHTPEK